MPASYCCVRSGAVRQRRGRSVVMLVLCVAVALPRAASAQNPTSSLGRLAGVVVSSDGSPIAGAQVYAPPVGVALTDSLGRFNIGFVTIGAYKITVRRLGFSPVEWVGTIGSEGSSEIRVELTPLSTMLAPITVTARRQRYPRVYERMEKGLGVTRFAEDLKKFGAMPVDDVLDFDPRIRTTLWSPSSCGGPLVYVDGIRTPPPSFFLIPPFPHLSDFVRLEDIEVIEAFKSPDHLNEDFVLEDPSDPPPKKQSVGALSTGTPPKRSVSSLGGSCRRVVMIWTKYYRAR